MRRPGDAEYRETDKVDGKSKCARAAVISHPLGEIGEISEYKLHSVLSFRRRSERLRYVRVELDVNAPKVLRRSRGQLHSLVSLALEKEDIYSRAVIANV